ncbi:MAG: hypothetical protein PHI99_04005 [Syntrophales bacterium]|nr:hypothetical protein [Syntrophales bacterium]HPL64691.1 hypothetical protein [Syntrophales bacterium]
MDFCSQHGEMMKVIGRIDERTATMKENQDELFCKVNALVVNGAVEKAKIKPIYWVITSVAGAFIFGCATVLIKYFFR